VREPVSVFRRQKREVWNMKTFEVQFRYRDRNEATAESTVKVEASSLPGAVGKAAREFVKSLDRKQRFDMNKNGLEITAKSVGTTTEAQAETSAEAAPS
jgi:transcription initiation factor IIE alpha subunit